MSKLFRSRHCSPKPPQDAYSSLLDPECPAWEQSGPRGRGQSSASDYPPRRWLFVAESRPSWAGERPPTRKLVKDMNGSGRPSFSLELSDSDAEKEKGIKSPDNPLLTEPLLSQAHPMPTWAFAFRPAPPAAAGLYFALGAFSISATLLASSLLRTSLSETHPPPISSPLITHLPRLSSSEIAALPYPPDVLPGGRTVDTPYGIIHVFEWGPEHGEKVLLLHGISTPCLALGTLAEELVRRGYRVMVFDLFGRGYSDAPADVPYDIRLYTTQILLVLASSPLAWTGDDGFHLVGYSLGGGLAVPFARYFSRMVRSVVVIAGGGLIRSAQVGWKSRLLYSRGVFPERLLQWLVKRRLRPKQPGVTTETKMAEEVVGAKRMGQKKHENSDASGGDSFDNAVLLARRPEHTVSSVMDWQLRCHEGFIPAFVSSIRYAPIYDQKEHWYALGQLLAERRERLGWEDTADELPGLRGGKILLVLGASDPVIVKEELIHDVTAVLGEDGLEAVLLDAGHELVMSKGAEVAAVMTSFWKRLQGETDGVGT
ncbi:serine hydrolase-like protein [Achaetomium macrosporum]|uniref:Serine hydrolase-like protein n=1 Tax=Achaetomium macrosporum TaxID=79813 RepID=A0AAN7C6E9_9PEZI|nr:serine hydrolase-like protein [Achaetomium macrosporum]